ncbi:MAG TPA: site-specific integrase, partial [Roseiarcus sp.]|nr:site-specific integrase [Roseiarcus sp.]
MTSALEQVGAVKSPASAAAPSQAVSTRFLEAFAAKIRNKHTRRAYIRGAHAFLGWRQRGSVASLAEVKPSDVAAYIEEFGRERSAPTVKQRLAAIRRLFDWLVANQVMPVNPASSVRGPPHRVKRGKTP